MDWLLWLTLLCRIGAGQMVSNGVESFLGIPYTLPLARFQPPVAAPFRLDTSSTSRGSICPQSPSRLELVTGPLPIGTGRQDESSCGVLSIYRPVNATNLPIIAWLHGGAFVTGGSEIPWYDGSRLARDANAVVIAISYRLGIFGLLQNDTQTIEPGTQDVILALEWIRDHARRFGGDTDKITVFGQSAGAYMAQVLTDLRPDLFANLILQSSPASATLTLDQARHIRQTVEQNLPGITTPSNATTAQLLAAQAAALAANSNLNLVFAPISRSGAAPGGATRSPSANKKVLIAYTQDDGAAFAELRLRSAGIPALLRAAILPLAKNYATRSVFAQPALDLAQRLRAQGYAVATFKQTWVPKGFEYLGATHCTDLPLVWGHEAAWREAPMVNSGSAWSEWEARGSEYRVALGRFVWDGTVPAARNGRVFV